MKSILLFLLLICGFSVIGQQTDEQFNNDLQKHLDAVTNKNLEALSSTLSKDSTMILILPKTEMTTTAKEFLDYHKAWFASGDWTFETEIVKTIVGKDMGVGIVEIVYREPLRDGVPYFNRMIVSYDLRLEDGAWKVFKDQACSIEKSTDEKD